MSDEMFEGLVPEPPAPPAPPGPPVTPPPAPPGQSASPAAPPAPPYPPQYAQYGPPTESRSRGWIAALIVGIVLLVLICSCMATLAIIYLPHLVRAVEGSESYNGPAPLDPYEEDSLAALERYWANPADPNVVAEVGDAYYDWAAGLEAAGDSEEAVAKWKLAILYYDQAIGMDPENDAVRGDRAFALYYSGDPDAAAALQSFIDHASDNTDLSPQVESAREYLAELE